uniref:Uncharacterized protein n=1 Tax=Arundo donax TaxID=35708 RepID=A0A0A9CFH7_ARUDO
MRSSSMLLFWFFSFWGTVPSPNNFLAQCCWWLRIDGY